MERLRSAKNLSWRERQRARRELEVIEKSGFAPYFLIVHDVIEFARRRRILHNLKGFGRFGLSWLTCSASPTSTDRVRPIFERFLNSGRK